MILKKIDSKNYKANIQALNELLKNSTSEKQKSLIKIEKTKLENGHEAEKNNAYYIDTHFKNVKNKIVLHDIRLVHNGDVAQFDHIFISPFKIIILESKSTKGILTIKNDGSLEIKYGTKTYTQSNPIEQNKRHKRILASFLNDKFGFKRKPGITHKVLIHPETNVSNATLPDGFVKADSFASQWSKEIDDFSFFKIIKTLTNLILKEKRNNIANLLIENHNPTSFDYTKKFRLPTKPKIDNKLKESKNISTQEKESCPRCKEGILVLRKSNKKSDKYKSNEFYGCDRYPKCRFVKPL